MSKLTVERVLNKSGRIATSPFRIMPSFIIIGAKKCGTTSLFRYLIEHPNIGAPSTKEISYFDLNFAKGNIWYRSFFPMSLPNLESQTLITGEASASYICHPKAPKRIAKVLPHVKLIALLRDPVDRAYSHYHHTKRIGRENLSFEEAIAQEETRVRQIESGGRRPGNNQPQAYNYTYLSSGLYAEQLQNWLEQFSKQQLLVLNSEDFFRNPPSSFKQVINFLKLPSWSLKNYRKHNFNQYPEPLKESTRESLTEYFRPHNHKLFELLGTDFGWSH
ncbi:sulfotransferase domain-containing protein [Pleurocapsa sp. PCC 7319]|uniref:sulfotransferase domain-containing protein n=1 Tax=Pleurocapsa sp. PCC 7319 TaxID=118161 RepID=UPI00034D5B18|nr:sulfotransferase domain-containing protein [Pleurocapsa sp. PCC 7319]